MKKLIATAAVLAALVAAPAFAADAPAKTNLYVGADVARENFTSGTGTDFNAGDIYVGTKVLDNVALEAGYGQGFNAGRVDVKTVSVDAVGFVPVSQVSGLDLIAIAGPTYNLTDGSKSTWGYEFGTGAQLKLTDQVSLRGTVKFEDADFTESTSPTALKYTVGANYAF